MQEPTNQRRHPIGAVFGTALACAVLGAFNGCTVSVWSFAGRLFSVSPSFAFLLLPGFAVGAVLGTVVAISNARSHSERRRPAGLIWSVYGALWFASAGLAILACTQMSTAHDLTRLRIPIRFDRVNTVSGSFLARLSTVHFAQIDLKRRLPFEQMNAFVGAWQDPDKSLTPSPPRPEMEWQVTDVPESQVIRCWKGQYWSADSIGLNIGEFPAISGHKYTITARVVKPAPYAQAMDPHLQVQINSIAWTEYYVPGIYLFIGALFAGGIGMGCLFAAWSSCHQTTQPPNV